MKYLLILLILILINNVFAVCGYTSKYNEYHPQGVNYKVCQYKSTGGSIYNINIPITQVCPHTLMIDEYNGTICQKSNTSTLNNNNPYSVAGDALQQAGRTPMSNKDSLIYVAVLVIGLGVLFLIGG